MASACRSPGIWPASATSPRTGAPGPASSRTTGRSRTGGTPGPLPGLSQAMADGTRMPIARDLARERNLPEDRRTWAGFFEDDGTVQDQGNVEALFTAFFSLRTSAPLPGLSQAMADGIRMPIARDLARERNLPEDRRTWAGFFEDDGTVQDQGNEIGRAPCRE